MSENFDKLNTAYQMLQYDVYADKMMANVRCLLKQEPTKDFIDNDFKAGELVYLLAATYENFYERFTEQEHKQIEKIIMGVLGFYYNGRLLGREENMFFDEHIWQFEIRRFLQASLVLYDKYAKTSLELMLAKNHDYDEAWRSMRISSYTDLILMKIYRTKQIESLSGETLVSEGIDANYMDMINYSVFGLIKIEFGD